MYSISELFVMCNLLRLPGYSAVHTHRRIQEICTPVIESTAHQKGRAIIQLARWTRREGGVLSLNHGGESLMSTATKLDGGMVVSAASHSEVQPIGGLAYDWLMLALSAIFVGGLYLDGWAHNHGKVDQSFFTPWHAFFYGGFAITALVLIATMVVNRQRGCAWRSALPNGYELSLLGSLVFAAGGVGDLIWHTLFGIEESFEVLVSPTHLLLGLGLALVVSGPLRSAWRRHGGDGWRDLAPGLASLGLLLSTMTFFMMMSHPLVSIIGGVAHREFASDEGQIAGVVSLMMVTGLMLGAIFVALRRWRLPPGSLMLVWGLNVVAMAALDWGLPYHRLLTSAMLLAVLASDLLLWRGQSLLPSLLGLRVLAFSAPVLLCGAYFLALLSSEGSRWSIHLLGGAIVLPGVAGLLLSYVAWPPEMP